MVRAARLLRLRPVAALCGAALLGGAAPAVAPGPHPDPEAIREARGGPAHLASPHAISHYLEARRRQRAGDPEGAVAELRLAVTWDEGSAELRVALAEALLLLGRLDGAGEEAERALSLARSATGLPSLSEARTAADAQRVLAQVALARREPEQAIPALREAIRLEVEVARRDVADPEPWRLLAELYAATGRPDAAEETLEALASLLPADAGAGYRELGRRALEADEPGGAERWLRRATTLDPGDTDGFRLLAAAFEGLKRRREAREAHLAVLRLDPDDPRSTLALGRISLREGDVEQAREWFRRHVRASSQPGDAHVRCAFEWLEDERAEEALAAAREGLSEVGPDPRLRLVEGLALRALRRFAEAVPPLELVPPAAGEAWVPARIALADALSRAGRHAEAERVLVAALAVRPGETRLVTARARARARAGRAGEAVAAVRAAMAEGTPDGKAAELPELQAALAEALAAAGKGDEALAGLRAALSQRPRDGFLLYAMASLLERLGQREAALAQMRALLVLEPDNAEAMNFIGFLLAEENVRLEEAELHVRRALELEPRAGHVHDSLGWVLHRKGDHLGAVAALLEALRLSGPDPAVLEHLGDAYRALGRTTDAVRTWRQALGEPGDGPPAEEARRRAALERKLRELGRAEAPARPVSLTPGAARR
jgi:tetratricopeptide (TPR) repeat protein